MYVCMGMVPGGIPLGGLPAAGRDHIYIYIYILVYIYIYIYIQVWQVFHVGGLMCNLEQQKLHLEIWDFSASVNSNVLSP